MDDSPDAGDRRTVITFLNDRFADIAGWSFDHRWWVLLGCVALAIGSLALASKARDRQQLRGLLRSRDPTYRYYEQYRDDFGSDEISYILYEAPGFEHGPWNLEVMRRIAELTRALEDEVPFIYDVTSPRERRADRGRDRTASRSASSRTTSPRPRRSCSPCARSTVRSR